MAELAHQIDLPAMDVGYRSHPDLGSKLPALLYFGSPATPDEGIILEFIGPLRVRAAYGVTTVEAWSFRTRL